MKHRVGLLAAFSLLLACLSTHAANPAGNNVVLFVGDGMGVSTVTAARILAGQMQGNPGEEHELSFERFEQVALIKTYTVDRQVPDSAATMTAIVSGKKTRFYVLGVDPSVAQGDCKAALSAPLTSILELAEDAGIATGVVTTTSVTHATPAANFAHSADRGWENNAAVPAAAQAAGCIDIARQLVEFDRGNGIEVVLGGGRGHFLTTTQFDPEYPQRTGQRTDGRRLIEAWHADGGREFVWNSAQFGRLKTDSGTQVLGLFEPEHMQFDVDRAGDGAGEPSLAEMTRFALEKLRHTGKPFYLVVEGGRIDHGHHFSNAYRALTDTLAFDAAVQTAVEMTSADDTLILVTADHSHTMTIGGYPRRGNPILGKVEMTPGTYMPNARGKPFTTISYANGPGYQAELPDLTEEETSASSYQQLAAIPLQVETHSGEDVAAYARGPGSELVRGVMEQNELFAALYMALFGKESP